MEPLVSVAVITYNHEKYLAKALDSILAQKTDFSYEIVVGEDCSPDSTKVILQEYEKKYPDKIVALYNKPNKGIIKNTYDVLMQCKGKYIAYLEGDDYWTDRDKMQKQLDFLREHPQYMTVAHRTDIVDRQENVIQKALYDNSKPYQVYSIKDFIKDGFIYHTSSMMFHNIFLEQTYDILATPSFIVSDLTLALLLFSKTDIPILNETMSAFRLVVEKNGTSAHSKSSSSPYFYMSKSLNQINILESRLGINLDGRRINGLGCLLIAMISGEKKMPIRDLVALFGSVSLKVRVMSLLHPVKRTLTWPLRRVSQNIIKKKNACYDAGI